MCGVLALLFIAVPILEIWLVLQVGSLLGLPLTLGVIVITALVGAVLARWQGFTALRQIQRSLVEGRRIGAALAGGALVLVSALLLLTPGFATDVVGIALLVPVVRGRAAAALSRRLKRHVMPAGVSVVDLGARAGAERERERDHDDPPPPGVIDV